jgi:hypothetical protein
MQHGRPDENPREDLGDNRGNTDPLGHLGRDLGGDEDDQDVEKDVPEVHGAAGYGTNISGM